MTNEIKLGLSKAAFEIIRANNTENLDKRVKRRPTLNV